MPLSWTGIKISIAGAKLSHLAQKDKIWDYGSMVEQVKMVFGQIEKVKRTGQVDALKKYMTIKAYEVLKKNFCESAKINMENVLLNISIVEVDVRNEKLPDRFCALIRGVKNYFGDSRELFDTKRFLEQWFFIRQGDWWVLDQIKIKKSFINN